MRWTPALYRFHEEIQGRSRPSFLIIVTQGSPKGHAFKKKVKTTQKQSSNSIVPLLFFDEIEHVLVNVNTVKITRSGDVDSGSQLT